MIWKVSFLIHYTPADRWSIVSITYPAVRLPVRPENENATTWGLVLKFFQYFFSFRTLPDVSSLYRSVRKSSRTMLQAMFTAHHLRPCHLGQPPDPRRAPRLPSITMEWPWRCPLHYRPLGATETPLPQRHLGALRRHRYLPHLLIKQVSFTSSCTSCKLHMTSQKYEICI